MSTRFVSSARQSSWFGLRLEPGSTNASQSEAISSIIGSFGGIAKKLQYLNDTLGNLYSLGIQHNIQLPKLVLVGDQSAGKSSLVSGLAGINLPITRARPSLF